MRNIKPRQAADAATPAVPTVGDRVGSFRYFRAEDRWEWSQAVAEMHGYAHGQVKPTTALVIGERMRDGNGDIIGTQGLYVDLSNVDETGTVDATIADFTEHRAIIEQAKGVLMLTYGISAERAFDILVWRSQNSNTKLRWLARQVVDDFTTTLEVPAELRERADHLLLTAHQRATSIDSRSDAC